MRIRYLFLSTSLLLVQVASYAQPQNFGFTLVDKKLYPSGPPPLMRGKTDKERWSNFLAAQPKLPGMTVADVERLLGKGRIGGVGVEYTLVAEKKVSKPNEILAVEVTFIVPQYEVAHPERAKVEGFEVRPIRNGGTAL